METVIVFFVWLALEIIAALKLSDFVTLAANVNAGVIIAETVLLVTEISSIPTPTVPLAPKELNLILTWELV
jgi:hypothetical protein